MACSFRVLPEFHCVAFRCFGTYRVQDCVDSTIAAMADAAFLPDMAQISDITDITHFDIVADDVNSLATRMAELSADIAPGTPFVIIAKSDLQFGLARMFQQVLDGRAPFDIHVVRDRPEIAALLNRQSEDIDNILACA